MTFRNIHVRSARSEEAAQLSKIAVAAKKSWNYPDHWLALWGDKLVITPEFIVNNRVWVACDTGSENESLLGFIALSLSGAVAEIEHMWIWPEYMKQGIGRKLLEHVLQYCRDRKLSALKIEADPNARGFYEKFGARQVGEIKSIPSPRVLPVLMISIKNRPAHS